MASKKLLATLQVSLLCRLLETCADVSIVNTTEAKKVLKSGLERVIAAEPDVTHYDTIVGKFEVSRRNCLPFSCQQTLTRWSS